MSTLVMECLHLFADEQVASLGQLGMKFNYHYYTKGNLPAPTVQTGGLGA